MGDSSRKDGFNPSSILRGIIGSKRTPITSASSSRRFKFPCQQPSVARTQRAAAPRAELRARSRHQTGNNSLSDSVCQVAESTAPREKKKKNPLWPCTSVRAKEVNRSNTYTTTVNTWVCCCLHNIPCAARFGLICSRRLKLQPQ